MSTYSFNAEIPKLMKMIIHNFYSSKDIFIRELISNASDAIDKVRFQSLNNPSYIEANTDFLIKIKANSTDKTLIIEDSGIGMTHDDLINCLGTIAKSGTEEFVKNIMNAGSAESKSTLIGQFGVGFYSAFLVADKVQVYSKHPESDNVLLWESDAVNGYSIRSVDTEELSTMDELKRGSRIVLYIKDDQTEYLQEEKISEIVKKHSSFTSYPIFLVKKTKVSRPKVKSEQTVEQSTETVDKPTDDAEQSTETADKPTDDAEQSTETVDKSTNDVEIDSDSDVEVENDNKTKSDVPPVEMEEIEEIVFDKLNNESLWMKTPSEVKPEEYAEFYKSISSDYDTYQKEIHFKAEGNVEFSSILFVPKRAPNDMFEKKADRGNIKLYVKRVLITDNCPDLYPEYFNFVKGVVDCPDLPLNASRELLQQSKITKQITKTLVKKTIELFNKIADDETEYEKFYENYSKNLKLATHEDKFNKEKLMELLRYTTSKSSDKLISLDTYIEQMKENQAGIYYINADSLTSASSSPFVEKLIANDYQVIYMVDAIDEYLMQNTKEYKTKAFINVANDDLKLTTEADKDADKSNEEICTKIKEVLGSKIEKVIVSKKLVSQPAIVSSGVGISANMERILKAQALGNDTMLKYMSGQKVLEINPEHKLIQKLKETSYDSELVSIIYDMGMLAGGYHLENMNDFLAKVYNKL